MKMKKFLLLGLLLLGLLLMLVMPLALGATFNMVDGGNYTGTVTLNCSQTTLTDADNKLNATIYYNASGGAAGDALATGHAVLKSAVNTTSDEYYETGISITGLTDALYIYNFSCAFYNGTDANDYQFAEAAANITIDNTNPVASITTDLSKTTAGRTIKYTSSVTDAIELINSSCTATDPEGTSKTLTIGASSLDFNLDRMANLGIWKFACSGDDRAGNTHSASTTVTTNLAGEDEEAQVIIPTTTPQQPFDVKTIVIIIGIIVAIIIWKKQS